MLIFCTFLILLFITLSTSQYIFITPSQSCGLSCTGDATDPYDNLLIALAQTTSQDELTIYLLNDPSASHYILQKEYDTTGTSFLYELTEDQVITMKTRTIRPLFCNDSLVMSTPSLEPYCIDSDQQLTIYLKTTRFSLNVLQNLNIQSIVYDASEDIVAWNEASSTLSDCLYNRKRCCTDSSEPSIECQYSGDYSSLTLAPKLSLINLTDPGASDPLTLTLENVNFENFISPSLTSLIAAGSNLFDLAIKNSTFDSLYFDKGFIYLHDDVSSSTISITETTFTNYNPSDLLLKEQSSRSEGYLIFSEDSYSGTFTITNSVFVNTTSSLRDQCLPLNETFYKRPMNNQLMASTYSKTDLWSQFYYDHQDVDGSSLFFFKRFDGTMTIESSSFQNILGTSGSVLRVDDTTLSTTEFSFSDTSFDQNFAYDGFANIRISKKSDPGFKKMISCPKISIQSSNFTNAYGCPGSYGNNIFVCPWDSKPPALDILSEYSITDQLVESWELGESYVNIQDSLFQGNVLSLSTSLAIIGSPSTSLQNNKFYENGGSTAQIALAKLTNSYFAQRYPSRIVFPSDTAHFGQATTIYMDRIIRLTSVQNQFWSNWGPWEGSRALGESLTIKNWIRLAGTMNFDQDEFAYHKGIPTLYKSLLTDSGLKNNVLTAPTITFSYDDEGTTAIYNKLPETSAFLHDIKITMNNVAFYNNTASYFGNKYTYNLDNVKNLVQGTNAQQKRFSTGLIKFLTIVESNDIPQSTSQTNPYKSIIGFVLQNATIYNNKLLSMGCLFPTQWVDSYFLLDSQVYNNQIYLATETFTLSANRDDPDLLLIVNSKQGLFCANIDDTQSLWGANTLFVNNAVIKNNKGILFNFAAENMNLGMFTNTLFANNTCWNASMITVFNSDTLFTNNVTFISNFNTLGNIFIYKQSQYGGLYHTYLYNSGLHASLFLVTQSENYFQTEHFVRAYWNDVNPTSIKLFANGLAPQGGLNFIGSSYYILAFADYRQNKAYSGVFNTMSATLLIDYANISDHAIAGTSVVGNFLSLTNVLLTNVNINNNSITSDPKITVSKVAMILLYTSRFQGKYVNFINGSVDGGAVLLFGNTVNTLFTNTTIKNFKKLDNKQISLFWYSFATVNFTDAKFDNTSSIFSIGNSNFYAKNVAFSNIKTSFDTQFIVQSFQSTIQFNKIKYTGNGEVGTLTSLIEGDKNYFQMSNSKFINATGGTNKIIDLKSSTFVYLGHNKFTYTSEPSDVQIMSFSSSQKIIVDSCVFSLAGKVFETLTNQDNVIFVNNIVITTSKHQNFLAQSVKNLYLLNNYIIRNGTNNDGQSELPIAPVQITDASGNVSITGNHFLSLVGVTGGLIIQSQQSPYNVNLTDNTFIQCKGSFGGAIELSVQKSLGNGIYSKAEITRGIFLSNQAKYDSQAGQSTGKGGAIFQTSLNKVHQETAIQDSIFLNNSAEILGGAIYFDYSPIDIDSHSIFLENYATRLNHIGSYPTQLVLYDPQNPKNFTYIPNSQRILPSSSNTSYQWNNIPSGLSNDQAYIFALLDMYGQLAYDDSSSQLILRAEGFSQEDQYEFSTKLSSIAQQGLYYYKDFVFNYQVNKKLNISFTSNAIQTPDPLSPTTSTASSITVQVSFRSCQFGEFFVVDNSFTKCQTCQAGFWSVSVDNMVAGGSCTECDSTSTICLGGSKIGPKYGYWRMNETADIVMQCPNEDSCLGNDANTDNPVPAGQCKEGAQGHLCNSCVEGWARSNPNSDCINCQTSWLQYLQLFGYVAVQVAFLVYGVRETMQMTQKKESAEANTAILLRIMINYVQIVSLVGEIPVTWPQVLKNFIAINSRFSSASSQFFSIDCFFIIGKAYTTTRIVFLKALLTGTLPFLYIFFAALFWIIYFKLKKRPIFNNKDFSSNLITTIVIICFNLQPDILKNSFQLFQCANLYRTDAPELFMNLDYDVQCWTPEHLMWVLGLGVPCLVLWGLVLPGYMFVILRKNIKKIETQEMRKKYSFIYMGYKTKKFYWEFIVMLRKILLICVTVFAGFQSVNLEIYLSLLVILFSYCLQKINKPYKDKTLNNLEKVCLLSAGIVNFCGLYFQIVKDIDGLDTLILISGLIGNLYFLFYFCKYFIICQVQRLKENPRAMKIINFILNKFCCCLKTQKAQNALTRARLILGQSKNKIEGSLKSLIIDDTFNNKSQTPNQSNQPENEGVSQIELGLSPNMSSIDFPGTLNELGSVRNLNGGGGSASSRHHLLKNPSRFGRKMGNNQNGSQYNINFELSIDGNITDRKMFKKATMMKFESDYEQDLARRNDKEEDEMNDIFDEICAVPVEGKENEAQSMSGLVSQIMLPSAISVHKLKSTNLDSACVVGGGYSASLDFSLKKGEL